MDYFGVLWFRLVLLGSALGLRGLLGFTCNLLCLLGLFGFSQV